MLDRSSGTGRHAQSERGHDLYETPPVAIATAYARIQEILPIHIDETACGRNALVSPLRERGHVVFASDLIDYGCDPTAHYGIDFLKQTKPPGYGECCLTNPPGHLAAEFVAQAIDLYPLVVMLLRTLFVEGGTGRTKKAVLRRYVLDENPPARILVFADRLPRMHRDGWQGNRAKPSNSFAWWIWQRGHVGPTTIERIFWKK